MKISSFTFKLLPALVLGCGVASADAIINVTGVDNNRGGSLAIRADGVDQAAFFAGVILISLTQNGQVFNRDTLCVDLFTDIYLGQSYTSTLLDPSMVPGKNLDRVSWLVDNALLPVQDSTATSALDSSDWVTTSVQGMGIQFAIWDIVHDGGDGFSSGRVQAASVSDTNNNGVGDTNAAVLTWAQEYEALSLGQSNDQAYVYNNISLANGAPAQMLIGPQFSDAGPVPIPEPQMFMPLGMGLIALSVGIRQIRKRS
jgi:hypothetical protein